MLLNAAAAQGRRDGAEWAARLLRRHGLLGLSMTAAVGGWGLMWAQSLDLVRLGPIWIPVAAFILGLLLIPCAVRRTPAAGNPDAAVLSVRRDPGRAAARCTDDRPDHVLTAVARTRPAEETAQCGSIEPSPRSSRP
jgi:hypothetical protein